MKREEIDRKIEEFAKEAAPIFKEKGWNWHSIDGSSPPSEWMLSFRLHTVVAGAFARTGVGETTVVHHNHVIVIVERMIDEMRLTIGVEF